MLSTLLALLTFGSPTVAIHETAGGFELLRNGRPYFVKGAGGSGSLDELAALGGNSVRSWGAEKAASELDEAQKRGISQTVGIWLGHKASFDYNDAAKVKGQLDAARATILRYRSHPALLMWGLGNEMEEGGNDTPALWRAIDDLHEMAHQTDPDHPAMTAVAEVSQEKIDLIKRYAPHLQVLGINSYGGAASLAKRLKEYGWTKPYLVTEFGPRGPWELAKTPWGAALEPDSTKKAAQYRESYLAAVEANRGQCLGAYAFLWGSKQEVTPTWFGMLLPTGERTEAADEMSRLWTGHHPLNRAPSIGGLAFSLEGREARAGIVAEDPDGDPLTYAWEIRREVAKTGYAGEGEQKPGVVPSAVDALRKPTIRFAVPAEPGAYRLYLTVRDGKGHAATANAPFLVRL